MQSDILLVDDSAADRFIFQEALREAAPEVRAHLVESGNEAIEFLGLEPGAAQKGCRVKLVLLDLNMPGLTGIETLRQIRSNSAGGNLPILILSSSQAKTDVDRAYWFGANAFVRKPGSLAEYIESLRVLVQHWFRVAELPTSWDNNAISATSR
jgi:two-component system, chemotaxis family, response regulator Rcp1